jgi:hypothetical protein
MNSDKMPMPTLAVDNAPPRWTFQGEDGNVLRGMTQTPPPERLELDPLGLFDGGDEGDNTDEPSNDWIGFV